MQTTTRKGRPPAAAQNMPAFLKAASPRAVRELPMSASTSKAVDEYIEWSSAKANIPKHEALYKFMDHVLGDFIRRDSLWQAERNARLAAPAADGGLPEAPTSGGAVAPASSAPRAEKATAGGSPPAARGDGRTSSAASTAGKAG